MNDIRNVGTIRKLIEGLNAYYWDLVDIDDGVDIGLTREEVLGRFDDAVGVEALDRYTVQYTLTAPTPYFLSYLVTELFYPLEKDFLDRVGTEDFGTTAESLLFNGAYYLSDWQRDKSITLSANPNYWDAEAISIDSINMQKVADDAIRVQMFQRGEISSTNLQGDQVRALQDTRWEDYIFLSERSAVTFWFAMNFTSENSESRAFMNNLNFRKALYHGIDRAKLLELYNPFEPERLLRNTVIPEEVIYDENGVDYTDYPALAEFKAADTYDRDLAREYFDAAVAELVDENGNIRGAEAGTVDWLPIAELDLDARLPVQIVYVHSTDSTETRLALLLQEMLREAFDGQVELVLGQYVDDKYNDTIKPRRFDFLYDSFRFGFADPMAQLGRLVSDGSINDSELSDENFDELVFAADAETAISRRYEIFSQAEAYFIDNVYVIPWQSGGGSYTMSQVVPFSYPRGGFGLTRYRYKGMELQAEPVTVQQYETLEQQFLTELRALNN
jgi:oligopeptide transport system substrate-binding protein